ncbi:MAG: Ig-like domain-containing protein, partial [Rhodoferax sp.]|nr:Ig-like domain-containing protein [Rhodoferax sp.]
MARTGAVTATLLPGMAATPSGTEKTGIHRARSKPAAKKPGKPRADVQQDSSATEADKALSDSQNNASTQASEEGLARASLTDSVLSDSVPSGENSSATVSALPTSDIPPSGLSTSVLDSNSLDSKRLPATSTDTTSVLLAPVTDATTTNHSITADGTHALPHALPTDMPNALATDAMPTAAEAAASSSASQVGMDWGIWAGGAAAAAGALALGSGGGGSGGMAADPTPIPTPLPTPTLHGPAVFIQSIGLGPLITKDPSKPLRLTASVYAADGKTIMGTGSVDALGQAHFTLDYAYNTYSGPAIVRVTGTADHLDEATGGPKHFDSASSGPLLAALVISAGQASTVNINPLTTFAAIEAGVQPDGSIDPNQPFTADTLQKASTQVARLIGLTGDNAGDRLTQITPIFAVDSGFKRADLADSDGVKVGTFLAIVSGLEKSRSSATKEVSTTSAIQLLNERFNSQQTDIEGTDVAPLLLEGAAQVSILEDSVNSYVFRNLKVITVGIKSDKSQLKSGDTASITFSFSVDPGNTFDAADINVSGGTLGSFSGSGLVRTATFTPDADNNHGSASIRIKADSFSGAGGTAGNVQVGSSPSIGYDTQTPTLAITSNKSVVKANETASITFSFSEDPGSSFDATDIRVTGGLLGTLSGSGSTRSAVFMPTANTDSSPASITVAAGSYTDAAGNNGGAGSTPTLTVDTSAPRFTSSASAPDIAENSAAGSVVYTAVATDTQAISYSLKASTGDAAAFSINSST